MKNQPTVFHITHYKAGSQWVAAILRECAPERFVTPKVAAAHFLEDPIQSGHVYPSVYVPRPAFDETMKRNGYTPEQQRESVRKFVVRRDLRDTLISLYFSHKLSHQLVSDKQAALRDTLQSREEEESLVVLLSSALRKYQPMQLTWLDDEDALHIRYEDLIADEHAAFEQIIDHCQIDVSRSQLREIVQRHSFESATGGRRRGIEDVTAHHRKGIAGDWQNHFTDRVKEEFKKIHGHVLIETGYETDLDW